MNKLVHLKVKAFNITMHYDIVMTTNFPEAECTWPLLCNYLISHCHQSGTKQATSVQGKVTMSNSFSEFALQ